MNKKIIELEKVIDNAIAEIKQAFDEVKTEVISVDEPEYKTVDRVARVGESILITNPDIDSAGEKGEVFTVIKSPGSGAVDVSEIRVHPHRFAFYNHEYEVIVPKIETVKRRAEVGERILITDKDSMSSGYENGDIAKVIGHAVDGLVLVDKWSQRLLESEYEVIIEPEQVPVVEEFPDELTPNEKRDELIKGSKRFILTKINSLKSSGFVRGGFEAKERENPKFYHLVLNSEFIVNEEKRTVVALLRGGESSRVYSRGIAKCMPNEVFNVYIGKAIALARALEIDVPEEFLDAVQPDKIVAGMRVQGATIRYPKGISVRTCLSVESPNVYTKESGGKGWLHEPYTKIINDTNAIYGGDPQ